jgi:hypothetical protein
MAEQSNVGIKEFTEIQVALLCVGKPFNRKDREGKAFLCVLRIVLAFFAVKGSYQRGAHSRREDVGRIGHQHRLPRDHPVPDIQMPLPEM